MPDDELENDDLFVSPDDELEESRQNPLNAHVGDDSLMEDNDSPAANPTDTPDYPAQGTPTVDDTHPSNDTDVDSNEAYDQGP